MLRVIAASVGGVLLAAIAIAAAHIPARYAGPFPSVGQLQNITGVFAGASLSLKATRVRGTRFTSTTGQFNCSRTSSTQTRCNGRFVGETGAAVRTTLTITWADGVPVAMTKGM